MVILDENMVLLKILFTGMKQRKISFLLFSYTANL